MGFIFGVDEAGRGPLAGPVAVGVVAVPSGFDVLAEFPGVKDSKKLSEKRREEIFEVLKEREGKGDVKFVVEMSSAPLIDSHGISHAVRDALNRGVNALAPDAALVEVFLDGSLKAPAEYRQQTIINGDDLVPIISLASIAAKVTRDRLMVELAIKYPEYGFDKHKGYGTRAHYEALQAHGLCDIHRRTFIHIAGTRK